jgi:RNA polymerase sigma-70 factor (ECF subfamily)
MPLDDDTPDDALVTRAQGGDRAALGLLVRRHQRAVFALCLRYVGDADEAADLCQRAFVRVMTKLGDLRDAGVFRAWVMRIGAHLALNHIRDNARFVPDDDEVDRAADPGWTGSRQPPAAPAFDRLEAAEAAAALRDAVRLLPTKQRMTLELRIYEDLPFREIAAALGTSEGAAKVNFHSAVRKLRARLASAADGGAHKGKGKPR